jgi:hypothetical protein
LFIRSEFTAQVIKNAWIRQRGRCAACGKELTLDNRDRGEVGAWHAHHRKPLSEGGGNTLRNCVILCANEPNCHFNIGHGGLSTDHYEPLSDFELPYLYTGRDISVNRIPQMVILPMPTQKPMGQKRMRKSRKVFKRNRTRNIMPGISTIRGHRVSEL